MMFPRRRSLTADRHRSKNNTVQSAVYISKITYVVIVFYLKTDGELGAGLWPNPDILPGGKGAGHHRLGAGTSGLGKSGGAIGLGRSRALWPAARPTSLTHYPISLTPPVWRNNVPERRRARGGTWR